MNRGDEKTLIQLSHFVKSLIYSAFKPPKPEIRCCLWWTIGPLGC